MMMGGIMKGFLLDGWVRIEWAVYFAVYFMWTCFHGIFFFWIAIWWCCMILIELRAMTVNKHV